VFDINILINPPLDRGALAGEGALVGEGALDRTRRQVAKARSIERAARWRGLVKSSPDLRA
jgi:hypothetical protein